MENSTVPNQKIPKSKKTELWKHSTIDYFERMSRVTSTGNRTSNYKKLINYELFNGRFNKSDLEYVINPFGFSDAEFPATLQHYDIISPAIMLLIGEESQRPDNQLVVSEGPNDINRKKDAVKAKVYQALLDEVKAEMGEMDPADVRTPEEILQYEKYSTSDLIESQANKLLKVLRKHLDVVNVYKRGWKDALISGEEIYWSGIINGEPTLRRVNPVDVNVVMPMDSDYIDDAVAVVEVRLLPVSVIIDEFGDDLTAKQIDDLERLSNSFYANDFTQGSFNLLTDSKSLGDISVQIGDGIGGRGSSVDGSVRVVRVEWKGMCQVGTLTYIDPETDELVETTITEDFDLKVFKEVYPDAKVEWYWITEAWEGTKIGTDIYLNVKAKPNQRRRLDNPYYCRLGYTGMLYNATNSVGVSLVDRMKPYQYLYNILMYRLELAFASDMGKVMLMDLAQIPKSEGITVEQWMYYLKAMKIAFVNSFEESKKGTRIGQISQFNQFQAIDLSLANTIQQYINSLEYIKQQIAFLSGISPQRLSSIGSNELVGNVERSIQQSSYITEYWFDMHNEVKRRTYTALIECAKIAYREGLRRQYVLDDMGIELLEINGQEFDNSEFSVYVSNSNKDYQTKEGLKQLFETALSADKANFSDIVEILQSDSIKDMQYKLQGNEERRAQAEQAQAQAQNELQQQAMAMQAQKEQQALALEERKLDLEEYKIQSVNETRIRVAEIGVFALQKDIDLDDNGIPDPIEVAEHALNQQKVFHDKVSKDMDRDYKQITENKKINTQKEMKDRELAFKNKELVAKERMERDKNKTALRIAKENKTKAEMARKKSK